MDKVTARLLVRASEEAYKRQPDLPGFTATPVFKGQVQSFIFKNDHTIIIAFRGTESSNLFDWATDFKFRKRPIPEIPGKWHRGFIGAVHQVALRLISSVHFSGQHRKFYITGHSMGAGLSGIFAAYLTRMKLAGRVDGIALFGSPRFANKEGVGFLDAVYPGRIHRWTVLGDRVARIPPFLFGYRHVGIYHELEEPYMSRLDKLRVLTRRLLRGKHHSISTYRSKLEE